MLAYIAEINYLQVFVEGFVQLKLRWLNATFFEEARSSKLFIAKTKPQKRHKKHEELFIFFALLVPLCG